MAIFDAMFEFLDDEQLIGNTTTTYSGTTYKTIDWGASDLEMGAGEPVWLNVKVGTTAYAPTTTGDTVDVKLFADSVADGHDGNSTVMLASGPKECSTLTAGAWVIRVPLPVDIDDERYLGIGATFSQATTAGTLDAWLDHGPQSSFDTQVSTSNI